MGIFKFHALRAHKPKGIEAHISGRSHFIVQLTHAAAAKIAGILYLASTSAMDSLILSKSE